MVLGLLVVARTDGRDGPDAGADDRASESPVALVATDDEQGSFMTPCEYSHSGPDDPIVHAGHEGMSHEHEFFGATTTDAGSTAEALLDDDTTCRSVADRSAYWAPALLVDGEPVRPTHVVAYYRVPVGADATEVVPPPNGLEMIAGDAEATDEQDPEAAHWACGPQGEPSAVPVPCADGIEPVLRLTFEPCWDGRNLGSPDHRSHLAPLGDDGSCPDDHPVLLPELLVEVRYPDRGELGDGELSLASGPVTGGHGDALMAWDEDFIADEVATCLNKNLSCDVVLERSRLSLGSAGEGSS
jgi:hypothetical protein